MLDRYNPLHLEEIRNKLLKYADGPVTKENVFDEIARINGEMAGLPANNTARDRIKLFSDNPILNYHWTNTLPENFGEFPPYLNEPWDILGVHTGTPSAANDRMAMYLGYDGFNNIPSVIADKFSERVGAVMPLIIDGDRRLLANDKPVIMKDFSNRLYDLLTSNPESIFGKKPPNTGLTEEELKFETRFLREKFFKKEGNTTIPYLNQVEDSGSISHITPPENIKGLFARFDPKQFRNLKLMDAVLAAPMPAMLDPAITKKNNETARQAFDFATGFVPVLGSAREAARDFNKGDYGWAAANAAMAAAEMGIPILAGVKVLKPALMKGLSYLK